VDERADRCEPKPGRMKALAEMAILKARRRTLRCSYPGVGPDRTGPAHWRHASRVPEPGSWLALTHRSTRTARIPSYSIALSHGREHLMVRPRKVRTTRSLHILTDALPATPRVLRSPNHPMPEDSSKERRRHAGTADESELPDSPATHGVEVA